MKKMTTVCLQQKMEKKIKTEKKLNSFYSQK